MIEILKGQVWTKINDSNNDLQRIILEVFNKQGASSQQSVLYVEYWKDEDRIITEGYCGVNHLRTWGELYEEEVGSGLIDRIFQFIIESRARKTEMMLKDLASVLIDPKLNLEVLHMAQRVKDISTAK